MVSDLDENEDSYHNWNAREEKKPMGTYIVIFLLCLLLGWMLGQGQVS